MKNQQALLYLALTLLIASLGGCKSENPRVVTKLNIPASLPASLSWNPLEGRVLTTWVDAQHSTMSTLYGNDAAINSARAGQPYPAGASISLITWQQQEDERWFGAKIPSIPQSVEFVTIEAAPDRTLTYKYQNFSGNPLSASATENGPKPGERATQLLSQKPAPMP